MRNITRLAILLPLLALTACGPTPEQKVQQAEAAKEKLMESSGYNACMAGIAERNAAEEKCVRDGVVAAGYTDGVDCIMDGSIGTAPCTTQRYNAEVDAKNACHAQFYTPKQLSAIDCLNLLTQ